MIRLTDEEIQKLPKFITSKITTRPDVVAQAQLKKVVEELKHSIAAEYYSPEAGCDIVGIPTRDWQALLEEVT